MIYLLADTVTGVWEAQTLEGEECTILPQEEFLSELKTLTDGELIGCEVDAEFYAKIDHEYGIQFLQ